MFAWYICLSNIFLIESKELNWSRYEKLIWVGIEVFVNHQKIFIFIV